MSAPDWRKAKQGEGQDRNTYNAYKRIMRDISKLTNEQLAAMHFESWHESWVRSGKQILEEN